MHGSHPVVTALVLVAGATALADWYAVWRGIDLLEQVAKSAVPALLVAAILFEADWSSEAVLVVVGLGFALGGDIALLPRLNQFVVGLALFLVTNIVFAVAFLIAGPEVGWLNALLMGAVILAVVPIGRHIIRAAGRSPENAALLRRAVASYVGVQGVMALAGLATGDGLAMAGALLLATSDVVLGWNRFVTPLGHGRLATHALYHAALVLTTGWVLW